ncbi:MAG TPA: hypothetical protein VN873_00400 [Candidatus Angelobacter sp.]|nr:hypothetical protein [Candidatus Angelobacter sp.]
MLNLSFLKRIQPPLVAVVAIMMLVGAPAATLHSPGGLSVTVDPENGHYELTSTHPAWTFAGSVDAPVKNIKTSHGHDSIGAYQQIAFKWQQGKSPFTGRIRLYNGQSVALFSQTAVKAAEMPPAPFPAFTALPRDLHVFSYAQHTFATPAFKAYETSTPWLLFNDQADAVVISPASHFMVASMIGDGHEKVASGFNSALRNLPAGFTQDTLVAFGNGINKTWDSWGRAIVALGGVKRPASDADIVLKYLGYWTDNGAAYYYNYDPDKGYAGTLKALVERYRQEQIPIHYLQLDSWWYYKSTTDADGKIGPAKKSNKLPEGEWNRYGGLLEYKAHKDLFPNGLAAFQKSIGLPLVTHNRWIDPASPYHQKYKISGVAAVDPKWWNDIAHYMKESGIVTYEQDWLDRIYTYSPEFASKLGTGEAFLGDMSRACAREGITMQYCMLYPCYYLQGSRYPNLTTIRTSDDRFNPDRWNVFLYASRLADSLGIWPWADVYMSAERTNVLLSNLSAGPVGTGDLIGSEVKSNIFNAVRADGLIVKPDAPIVPLDQSYIADAKKEPAPLLASTYTDHDGIRTVYVFAYNRGDAASGNVKLNMSELGLKGPMHGGVYAYDFFNGTGKLVDANGGFSATVGPHAAAFYVFAPVGQNGIAFLGDRDKFVGTGKQRITSLREELGLLSAGVELAPGESSIVLHGYAKQAPKVSFTRDVPDRAEFIPATGTGTVETQFDSATGHFTVEVKPAGDDSSARKLTVMLRAR